MDSAVEEARETEGLNTQNTQDTQSQSNFPQNALPTYTQAAGVPNGTEVAIGSVPQVIESHAEQGDESLSISSATAVQVAVAVGSGEGVGVVEGATERAEDGGSLVTALPAEYGLAASLAPQYVIQHGSPTDEEGAVGDLDGDDKESRDDVLREQDRFLPIANVARIMKKSIPKTGKIAKDAKECVQECVSEFISFITSEASERCHQEKRKTINGEDILFAMQTLGFDNYVEPLKLYLQKYRESIKGEKSLASATEGRGELEDEEHTVQQYQVAGHMHPTMITTDQPPTTIYNTQQYQTTLPQQLHFQ